MIGHIETACFNYSGGREMIFSSNREAEWICSTPDIRECYGKIFDKESGASVLMFYPAKNGIMLTISKMIPNRFGDNLTAYLNIPNALDISGETLQGIVFDVISSLAHNRRDVVSSCLSSISNSEYEQLSNVDFEQTTTNSFAYRRVQSGSGTNSLTGVLNNLFQDYYWQYKYIFIAIDNQHIANSEQYKDLTDFPLEDWRPAQDKDMEQTPVVDNGSNITEDTNNNDLVQSGSQNEEITSEWLKANTEIHGWLSFFFFAIIAGGLFSAIYPIATFNASDYAGNFCLGSVDIVTGFLLLAAAGYTVYAFNNRKPNAVFWGKVYVVLVVLTNILALISGSTEENGLQSVSYVVRGIIWGVIWFLYLTFSDQVQEIIPKLFRKITSTDWAMLSASILLPIFLLIVGLSQISSLVESRTSHEVEMEKSVLEYNQRTDGRIIFTIPSSFSCSQEDVETDNGVTVRVYSIEDENKGNCTLCSDYDQDITRSNFNSYMINWKDPETVGKTETPVDEDVKEINGSTCMYKIVSYNVNGVEVYWRYYLLFNKPTGKVAILSAYDINQDDSYIDEILESIRFQ